MEAVQVNRYIIIIKALYFGWLLSFPFYGPVFNSVAPVYQFHGYSLPLIFVFSHALGFLLGGLFLSKNMPWDKLMTVSLAVTIVVNLVLLWALPEAWLVGMIIMGLSSAGYILGWNYLYSMYVPLAGRFKVMASVIIGANLVYIMGNLFTHLLNPFELLLVSMLPLWFALIILLLLRSAESLELPVLSPGAQIPAPAGLMLVFCLFIAGLYLCSGFMYNLMQPFLLEGLPQYAYYHYLPYIAILVVMYYVAERLKWFFSIYLGVSLLGLAFVAFALVYQNIAGLLLTAVLIESAYALLDLFIWVTLGYLAFTYGAPYQFFGFSLAAMLLSILAGDLVGAQLEMLGEDYRLITALFAAGAIFLTFLVIPWLNDRLQHDLTRIAWPFHLGEGAIGKILANQANQSSDMGVSTDSGANETISVDASSGHSGKENLLERALKLLLPHQKLTPREMEVTALLLEGHTNQDIAGKLFISENTLKTHLRNIYPKYGVTRKRELLSLVLKQNRDHLIDSG